MSVALPDDSKTGTGTGWQAELELGFEQRPLGTVLKHIRHQGPLRVQRPFYPEEALPHVYLLHPPGGVAGGDRLDISVGMQAGSRALLTSPGSTRFYRSAGATAYVRQTLTVEQGGSLEWLPQENIIFPGARVNSQIRIELAAGTCFIGWDITCLGRPCNEEAFDCGRLYSRLALYRDRHPLLNECQRVTDRVSLDAATGLRGHPMQALFLATPCEEIHLQLVRETLAAGSADFPIAATLVEDLLIVRALGRQAEAIQQQFIPLWQALRPHLLNRPAVVPRIWAT